MKNILELVVHDTITLERRTQCQLPPVIRDLLNNVCNKKVSATVISQANFGVHGHILLFAFLNVWIGTSNTFKNSNNKI